MCILASESFFLPTIVICQLRFSVAICTTASQSYMCPPTPLCSSLLLSLPLSSSLFLPPPLSSSPFPSFLSPLSPFLPFLLYLHPIIHLPSPAPDIQVDLGELYIDYLSTHIADRCPYYSPSKCMFKSMYL